MNQIVPHLLWLGHAREGRDYQKVFEAGVRAVVELAAEESPSIVPRELVYCRFPLLDGPGNETGWLYLAIHTVATLLERRVPTLVSGGAGLSRSPTVAAAALSWIHQESPEECLQRVTKQHPSDVSPGLWSEVREFLATQRSSRPASG